MAHDIKNTEESPHKTTIVLKVPSQKNVEELSDVPNNSKKDVTEKSAIEKLRENLVSALKIITIATFAEDDIAEDFFSDFNNYFSIAKKLKEMKLISGNVPLEEDDFNRNSPDCWMKIIIIIFVSLYSFPDNSGIYCDVITSSDAENNSKMKPVGTYLYTTLRLEAYDWNEHKVDVYIPNNDGERMLFLVDDEPALYTIVHNTPSK